MEPAGLSLHEQIKDIIRRAVVVGHASAWLDPEEAGGSRATAIAKLSREMEELIRPLEGQIAFWKAASRYLDALETLDAPDGG